MKFYIRNVWDDHQLLTVSAFDVKLHQSLHIIEMKTLLSQKSLFKR